MGTVADKIWLVEYNEFWMLSLQYYNDAFMCELWVFIVGILEEILALPDSTALMAVVFPDNNVHGASMGPIWGRQDPGGPHVGPMNWV